MEFPKVIYAHPIKYGSASGKWYKKGEGKGDGVVYIRMDIARKKTQEAIFAAVDSHSNYIYK